MNERTNAISIGPVPRDSKSFPKKLGARRGKFRILEEVTRPPRIFTLFFRERGETTGERPPGKAQGRSTETFSETPRNTNPGAAYFPNYTLHDLHDLHRTGTHIPAIADRYTCMLFTCKNTYLKLHVCTWLRKRRNTCVHV